MKQILVHRSLILGRSAMYILILSSCVLSSIQYPASSIASSGASFLKIPVGARAVGMGGAYTAAANDINSLFWNPAGLTGVRQKEMGVTHATLFAGTKFNFIGYAQPVKGKIPLHPPLVKGEREGFVFGAGVLYLSQGSIEGRSADRTQTADFSASDLAIALGISRKISQRSNIGGSLKMIRQSIGSESANGWAADFGVLTQTPRIQLGFSILNMGPPMKLGQESYSLPLSAALGVTYRIRNGLLFSFDFKQGIIEKKSIFGFGAELPFLNIITLRSGYLSSVASLPKSKENGNSFLDKFSGLNSGIGLKLFSSQIDYAFSPMGELGNSHRISLSYRF